MLKLIKIWLNKRSEKKHIKRKLKLHMEWQNTKILPLP